MNNNHFVSKKKKKKKVVKGKELVKTGRGRFKLNKDLPYYKLTPKKRLMVKQTATALVDTTTKTAAAEMLDISIQSLYNRMKKYPQIGRYVEEIEKGALDYAKKRISRSAPLMADGLVKLATESESEHIRLSAINSGLDRAGIVKPQPEQKTQINVFNAIKKDNKDYDL